MSLDLPDLIESDCIAHTERDNCSRPIKSRTDEERDLVAVVEVARDRRVDPDRTCCRVDDAAVHDKLVGFVHAAWSCPCSCDVECPCSCPLRDIHERPEEVAFCTAAATCHHLRQVACEVLDLAHAFSSCSRNDVDDRCLVSPRCLPPMLSAG